MTLEDFLDYRTKTGRIAEISEFRKLYKVTEVKVGTGEKQSSVFYVHEKTDPKGDYFQATTLGRNAADEQVQRCAGDRRKELISLAYQAGAITWYDVTSALGPATFTGAFKMFEPPVDSLANLKTSRSHPDVFVRLSGVMCERTGSNVQWLFEDALRAITLDDLSVFGLLVVTSEAQGDPEADPFVRLTDVLCKRIKKSMSAQESDQLAKQLEKRGARPLIPQANALVEAGLRSLTAEDVAEIPMPEVVVDASVAA